MDNLKKKKQKQETEYLQNYNEYELSGTCRPTDQEDAHGTNV